eukprot:GHVL01010185.1.p1 GENE.GHVL01010185.1~~GHVL01010185.1.p1  ORF type:complete len:1145 (-),score=159.44 GHVL01010185.1:823-4257(-)
MLERGPMGNYTTDRIRVCLEKTIHKIVQICDDAGVQEVSLLNLVVTDGSCIIATRHVRGPVVKKDNESLLVELEAPPASLYFATGSGWHPCEDTDEYCMTHLDKRKGVAIISSEPLTASTTDWVPVPKNHIVVVTQNLDVLVDRLCSRPNPLNYPIFQPGSLLLRSATRLSDTGDGNFPNSPMGATMFRNDEQVLTCVSPQDSPNDSTNNTLGALAQSLDLLSRTSNSVNPFKGNQPSRSARAYSIPMLESVPNLPSDSILSGNGSSVTCVRKCKTPTVWIFSGNDDGTLRLWNSIDCRCYSGWKAHSGGVLDISVESRLVTLIKTRLTSHVPWRLYTCSSDNTIAIWDVESCTTSKTSISTENPAILIVRIFFNPSQGDVRSIAWAVSVHDQFAQGSVALNRSDNDDQNSLDKNEKNEKEDRIWNVQVESTVHHNRSGESSQSGRNSVCRSSRSHVSAKGRLEKLCRKLVVGFQNTSVAIVDVDLVMRVSESVQDASDRQVNEENSMNNSINTDDGTKRELHLRATMFGESDAVFSCTQSLGADSSLNENKSKKIFNDNKGVQVVLNFCNSSIIKILPYTDVARHCGFIETVTVCGGCWDSESKKVSELVFTGGGDGLILAWNPKRWNHVATLIGHRAGILCMTHDYLTRRLFSGSRDRSIRIWDIDTHVARGTLKGHKGDVLAVDTCGELLFSSDSLGVILLWDPSSQELLMQFRISKDGTNVNRRVPVVSLSAINISENKMIDGDGGTTTKFILLAGTGDGRIRIWRSALENHVLGALSCHPHPEKSPKSVRMVPFLKQIWESESSTDAYHVQELLREFVAIRSVSDCPSHSEECFRAAKFVSDLAEKLGATVKLAPTNENPVVLAKWTGLSSECALLYSHYDVVDADASQWDTNPWDLTGIDGYLYGRGASDNKGPIIAQLLAIRKLQADSCGDLPISIVMICEGDEETGSSSLSEVLSTHSCWFTDCKAILSTNSYWLDDTHPCIVYGMRGVIDLQLQVTGGSRELHSGVHGGAIKEPVSDLVAVIASLTDPISGRIRIPQFYNEVKEIDVLEESLIQSASETFDLNSYVNSIKEAKISSIDSREILRKRWCEPSMTFTDITTSPSTKKEGNEFSTQHSKCQHFERIIPPTAVCNISIR